MWHVALESWQWIHQVAAPCNVICGSRMTCHRIRPNIRHIGILHLVSILTTSPQSTCHSAPVYRISSTWTDYGRKMTSCRFSKWRLSAILTFRGPIMGSLKSPCRPSYTSSRDTVTNGGVKSAQTPPCDILFFSVCLESPENQVTQTPFRIKRKI